jgi:hypothetical protein
VTRAEIWRTIPQTALPGVSATSQPPFPAPIAPLRVAGARTSRALAIGVGLVLLAVLLIAGLAAA